MLPSSLRIGRIESEFLVVDREPKAKSSGQRFLEAMRPYHPRTELRSEWQGTRLVGGKAEVLVFETSPEATKSLKPLAKNLYDWGMCAERPEDLCFLTSAARVIRTAHERPTSFASSRPY